MELPDFEVEFPDFDINLPDIEGLEILPPGEEQRRELPPDPLAKVTYSCDIEADSKAEMSAVKAAFIDRAKNEAARMKYATDSEYWFCVCFQSREQKDEFLANSGLVADGDKYIDGQAAAAKLGIKLSPCDPTKRRTVFDSKLAALAE